MEFHYDRALHWPETQARQLRIFRWLGWINVFSGSIYLLNYWKSAEHSGLTLLTGVCFLFSGVVLLWLSARNMKPFIQPGQAYLKIENERIYYKPNRFSKEKRLDMDAVKYVEFSPSEILFHLQSGEDFFIELSHIHNPAKRRSLQDWIKAKAPSV